MKIYFEIDTAEEGIETALKIMKLIDPDNATTEDKPKKKKPGRPKKVKKPVPVEEIEDDEDDDDNSSTITAADVRKAMKIYIGENSKKKAKKILSSYGDKLSDVDEDDYADLISDLNG